MQAQCAAGGTHGAAGANEYIHCTTALRWTQAENDCDDGGTGWHLVRINDGTENAFVQALTGSTTSWIGADDRGGSNEGTWRWQDGVQFWSGDETGSSVGGLYNNWNGGEPNNSGGGGGEDCAEIQAGGGWNDNNCNNTQGYVCEGPAVCGNGITGGSEECDDGNTTNGDGCDSGCLLETAPTCGDGLLWTGEACDDGDTDDGDGCSSTCTVEERFICSGEPSVCADQCLDGGTLSTNAGQVYLLCESLISWTAAQSYCQALGGSWELTQIDDGSENTYVRGLPTASAMWIGATDGAVEGEWRWPDGSQFWMGDETGSAVGGLYNSWNGGEPNDASGEDCAEMLTSGDWNDIPCGSTRQYVCETAGFCGDGIVGSGEDCDDGNTMDGDGCDSACEIEGSAVCGDGLIWAGENCDDGNTADGDGCSATCSIETGYSCAGQPSLCALACSGSEEWHSQMDTTTTEYFFCDSSATIASALATCNGLGPGWSLTTIDDAAENAYVDAFSTSDMWIGANDEAVEGQWRWRDGTQFWMGDETGSAVGGLYANWASGEPNDSGNEDCAELQDGGLWNDLDCTTAQRYVCEGPPICGNGVVALPERCDDGNTTGGDGCSASCLVEAGYECELPDDMGTPSVCTTSAIVIIDEVALIDGPQGPVLQWSTVSQSGTIGFVVQRRTGRSWKSLHRGVLPAANAAQGATYRFSVPDASLRRAQDYQIVEVDVRGARAPAGRWSLRAEPGELVRPTVGYHAQAHALRRRPTPNGPVQRKTSAPETGESVFAEVRQAGLQQVRIEALADHLGIAPAAIRSAAHNGQLRVALLDDEIAWAFDATEDALLFFGEASKSVYSELSPYRISLDHGARTTEQFTAPGLATKDTGVVEYRREDDLFAATVVSPDPESDYWFAAALSAGSPTIASYETSIHLLQAPDGNATLYVEVYGGWGLTPGTAQRVEVWVADYSVGTFTVDHKGPQGAAFEVPAVALIQGDNIVRLTSTSAAEPGVSGLYVDRFSLRVPQRLQTLEHQLLFTADASERVQAELGGQPRWILDLDARTRTEGIPGTHANSIRWDAVAGHRYLVSAETIGPALRAGRELAKPGSGAEYVVIAPDALSEAAEAFAAYRRHQGLSAAVWNLQAIYDDYGDGLPTPHAIASALRDAFEAWKIPPAYVLLLGDGSFDYRSRAGVGPGLIAPAMLATDGGLYASDALLGDFDADGRAEVVVGRLPVHTQEEALTMLDRIAAYEEQTFAAEPAFGLDALLVSGSGRGSDFLTPLLDVEADLSIEHNTRLIDSGALGVAGARAALFDALDASPYWLHYNGHGGLDRFDDAAVLAIADAAGLSNGTPFLLSGATCTISRFEVPGTDALAERLVLSEHGGAIASWAPSGLTSAHKTGLLSKALAIAMFDDTTRLGDVIRHVHGSLGASFDAVSLGIYVLLGDPALRIRKETSESNAPPPDTRDDAPPPLAHANTTCRLTTAPGGPRGGVMLLLVGLLLALRRRP